MEDVKDLRAKLAESEKRERELKARVEELSDFIENASLPLHWVNSKGEIIWANKVELDSLGYSKEEYIGHSIVDFHADKDVIADILARLTNNETLKNYPARLLCKDGTIKQVLINSNVYRKNGEFIHTRCFTRDISDLKAEEERKIKLIAELEEKNQIIRDRDKQLNHMFMQAPFTMSIIKGEDYIIELANKKALELWDRTDEQVLGKKAFDVFPELVSQGFVRIFETVYKKGETYISNENPIRLFRKGKLEELYINFIYEPIRDMNGKIDRIMGVGIEVTDQILARQKIEEAEERSRLAIEAADMGAFDWDLSTHSFYRSPRLLEIFGFKGKENTTHQDLISSFHPEDRPIRDKAVADSFSRGSLVYEARVIWPDKSVHWIRVYGKITYQNSSEPRRMFGIVMDITEQKEAEQLIKEDARKIRIILESLPQMAWTALPNGEVNYFNNAWSDYTGQTPAEVLGNGWSDIIHPDYLEATWAAWKNSLETGMPYEVENLVKRASDNQYRWMWVKAVPLKNAEGDILLWAGTITDIHEQKTFAERLEQKINDRTSELQIANQNLEKINYDLMQFASVASHDLKEPLRKILTFGSLLEDKYAPQLDEKASGYLGNITDAAKRMNLLIEDILSYSRLSDHSSGFEPVSLNDIIPTILKDLEIIILEKKAEIHVSELPVISGIPGQIRQVFQNLIINSLKFAKPGIASQITIQQDVLSAEHVSGLSVEKGEYCSITLRDNGIGFDMKYAEKIFTLFSRLHSKDAYEGTGIGLSIVKKIVDNHNGKILVESEPGKGTAFTLILPFSKKL